MTAGEKYEDTFPEFGSLCVVVYLSIWQCRTTHLEARLDLHGPLFGRYVCQQSGAQKLNPHILDQRQTAIRKDTKRFDKVFLRLFLSLTIIQPLVAGLDAVRFKSAPMPFWTVYLGASLFILSAILITWVLAKNPHAESSVRIQTDRDHAVVVSGPYRFVRHPMYVGLISLHTSMALILGSMWNLALAGLIAMLLLWRTGLEDLTLRRELPG